MDRAEALKLVEESFARGSNTPCTWAEDRDAYIAAEQDKLRARLIDPFPALIRADEWAQKVCKREPGPHAMWAIAHQDGQWLFYSTSLRQFFLVYGNLDDPNGLAMLGHSSDDALVEWLG
ncbi:MAG: hypothetical protein U1F20_08755 [Lysobacterales bacterium]